MLPIPEYMRRDVYPRLPGLIEKFGRTFHYYNWPGIFETGKSMNEAFAPLPFRQYFAVKACPEPQIMKLLFDELGFGFDCSSTPERVMANMLGARGEDVFYSSNDTSDEEFDLVAKNGGCILNIDDITFIPLIRIFPDKVACRINPGKRRTGHANNPIGEPYWAKYGLTYEQIIPAYKMLIRRGVKHFGIHIMICSNERHSSYFVETARAMLEIAALLYRTLGIKVEFINIGGGFGIPYRWTDKELHLEWIGSRIKKLFYDFAGEYGFLPELKTECGRFVTGPHGILVNPVMHVMQKYRHFIGVAAAMTGCPRPAFYGAHHHIDILDPRGNLRRGPRHFTNVVGPKCENWDRLTAVNEERLLPKSVRRGDILVTGTTGAHSAAMVDNYNGRLQLPGILDVDGTNENTILIRRAQTTEDLFRTMVFPLGIDVPHSSLNRYLRYLYRYNKY